MSSRRFNDITQIFLLVLFLSLAASALAQPDRISQIQSQLESAETDSQKINIIVELGEEAMKQGATKAARDYYSRARHLADSIDVDHARQKALYGFGDFYLVQQKYDSAETVLKQAMNLNPNPPLLYKVQNLLATSYRYQGQNQLAVDMYSGILANIDTTEQTRMAAGVSQNMADAYINMGYAAEAFKNYNKAVHYAEAAKDSLFLATLLNNIGKAHNDEEQFGEAAYYLERSLEISRAINFKPGQLRALTNIGITRSNQSRFQESESLYKQALELSKEVRPNTPPVQLQYNLGDLYNKMGNYDEAESYFRQSLEVSQKLGIPQGLYYNSTGLGSVAENRGNISEALKWANQALEVAQKLNNPSFLQDIHRKLYQFYKKQDDFEAAMGHLESFKTISDSLKTQERERMLAEYRTKLEVQQQQQQNKALQSESERQQAQLRRQTWLIGGGVVVIIVIAIFVGLLYKANREKNAINRKLEQRKAELQEIDTAKNRLFGIIGHDLRSPLSSLISMLDLFRDRALTEEEMRELMAELELALQQNVNIMENLLVWAEEQMSGMTMELKPLEAHDIAEEMLEAHNFSAQHKNITIKNKVDPDLKVQGDYNMLKLVMRNLISNAIKFSEDGDQIVLEASSRNGDVLFEVRDTGIGIPEDLQNQIFTTSKKSRKGTRDERGSGMGLNLCKEFIERQGGDIYLESEEGKGTSFFFTLPGAN